MRNFLTSTGLGAIIALCAFAIPGQATTLLSFQAGGCTVADGGCGTAAAPNGTNGTALTALDILGFNSFTEKINGVTVQTWSLSNTSLLYSSASGGTYTLTGDMSCVSGTCGTENTGVTPISLLTLSGVTPTMTGGTQAGGFGIALGAATSLTETATFLKDLDLSTPTGTPTASGGAASGDSSPVTAMDLTTSSTLSISTSQVYTPEPVSFLLFGTGLLAVTLIARRNTRRAATVPTA